MMTLRFIVVFNCSMNQQLPRIITTVYGKNKDVTGEAAVEELTSAMAHLSGWLQLGGIYCKRLGRLGSQMFGQTDL